MIKEYLSFIDIKDLRVMKTNNSWILYTHKGLKGLNSVKLKKVRHTLNHFNKYCNFSFSTPLTRRQAKELLEYYRSQNPEFANSLWVSNFTNKKVFTYKDSDYGFSGGDITKLLLDLKDSRLREDVNISTKEKVNIKLLMTANVARRYGLANAENLIVGGSVTSNLNRTKQSTRFHYSIALSGDACAFLVDTIAPININLANRLARYADDKIMLVNKYKLDLKGNKSLRTKYQFIKVSER